MEISANCTRYKIGVTSQIPFQDRLKNSDYSGTYTHIWGIGSTEDEKLARSWEASFIEHFSAKDVKCDNDPKAGGTGSLDSSGTYCIYVVYK